MILRQAQDEKRAITQSGTAASGTHRGGIDERWFASTTPAANENRAHDEGLSYVVAGKPRELCFPWLVVERRWTVEGADGWELGEVEETVGDSGRDIFNGLTVRSGVLGSSRYVPSERVAQILEDRVELDLSSAELDALDERGPQNV